MSTERIAALSRLAHARAAVTTALTQLAYDPDGVAAALLRHGATGVRNEPAACPVAVHIARTTGVDVCVEAQMWRLDPPRDTGRTSGWLPPPVELFVQEFDRGRHPELDRTQPEEP